ncbi:hypothetical protein L208DRAFT_1304725 [Tricholoma matsutake]|nr:hypothetical protein L208DRAFT_1304725 [Tricholoma matsutake 945]
MDKISNSVAPSSSPRAKPSTRSSIRHSLNLAGKAFVDVINKDARGTDKSSKKPRSPSSRRLSAISLKPSAPRTSMGDVKSPTQPLKRVGTPDSKTATRRRVSAGLQRSMDEQPTKSLDSVGVGATRPTSSLRPKNLGSASALPKLRPRSAVVEPSKPPSPRTGSRRRFNSDDEKEDRPLQGKVESGCSPSEKRSRPISPLPQRAALKNNLSVVNATLSTPSKQSSSTPSSNKVSPARPMKSVKTATSVSAVQSSIPRPASSTSSSGSFTPHTPKTPIVKTSVVRRSAQEQSSQLSPSPLSSDYDSLIARRSRKASNNGSPSPSPRGPANMSHISEVNSEDSEAEDVEMLLAPVAALGAPTPAMPRIQTRKRLVPQTPTRANLLPTRANMSYLSPLPPDEDSSSLSLRPPQQGSGKQARGSILSWEQLATEVSKTLGEDEIEHMLSDIPAPFRSGAVSPSPSTSALDIPESPCLSALNSPGGFGSISQVLLPEVTPSPAFHPNKQQYDMSSEVSTVGGATVTLLRLQLASVENTAKERLYQLQSMEQEMHNLKEARTREAHELANRVAYMEAQLCGNMEIQRRMEEEQAAYTSVLEDQLRQAQAVHGRAVEEAVVRSQENAEATRAAALESQRGLNQMACSARVAASEWDAVHKICGLELDIVQGDRQVLSVLLAELGQMVM